MNNLKGVVGVSVVVSLVVVLGAYFLLPSPTSTTTQIPPETLGAVPGNEINGNYFTIGGIDYAFIKQGWIASTTRVCIIKNPFPTASSTLLSFIAKVTNKNPGANKFDLATTTHKNGYGATSTAYIANGLTVPDNQQVVLDPNKDGVFPFVIAGSENLKLTRNATSSAGTDNYQGVCEATFQKI